MPGFLFDLDGVFYEGDKAINGGADTLAWCDEHNHPYLFVTNTTSRPRRQIAEKLQSLGIDAKEERILTPPLVACRWLEQHKLKHLALFISPATKEAFNAFEALADEANDGADAVVIGDMGSAWTFAVLNRAFRLMMTDERCRLLALGMTRYWRAEDGLRLDTGPFVAALQYATGREPVVCGKPALPFFNAAVDMLSMAKQEVFMVGDDIRGDIEGARNAKLRTILVRTGKFQETDLQQGVTPDHVIDSIADLTTVNFSFN